MIKELWINLPVNDVNKSRDFFTKIGFILNPNYGNSEHSASLFMGNKNIVLMLFNNDTFKGFTSNSVSDTGIGTEVLFSFDAESRAEVDELAKKVEAAGGKLYSKPSDVQGWMYGFGFVDLDGHRWNQVYMDFNKMPKH